MKKHKVDDRLVEPYSVTIIVAMPQVISVLANKNTVREFLNTSKNTEFSY